MSLELPSEPLVQENFSITVAQSDDPLTHTHTPSVSLRRMDSVLHSCPLKRKSCCVPPVGFKLKLLGPKTLGTELRVYWTGHVVQQQSTCLACEQP